MTAVERARSGRLQPGLFTRFALALLGALALFLVLEGAANALLAWADSREEVLTEAAHCVYDPDLGWSHGKGQRVADLYGPGEDLTVDALGFRGTVALGRRVPAGRVRLVCLGDSFTLGYGVGDESTYPAWLGRLDPRLQVVNMGQGGYGIDQCLLWYERDGAQLEADFLILAFIAPDFERMTTDLFDGRFPKPLLEVSDGRLVLPSGPVPDGWARENRGRHLIRFGENLSIARLFRRWKSVRGRPPIPADRPLAFEEVGELALVKLLELSRERGQGFAACMLPLRDRRAGQASRVASWMSTVAQRRGFPFLDLTSDFDALPPGEGAALYAADGHLNPWGNRFVAERLLERLAPYLPEPPR